MRPAGCHYPCTSLVLTGAAATPRWPRTLQAAAGARAVEHLAHIAIEAEMVPLRTVIIPHVGDSFGPDGQPNDPRTSAAAKILLDDLAWWAAALKQARARGTLPPAIMRLMAANEEPAK